MAETELCQANPAVLHPGDPQLPQSGTRTENLPESWQNRQKRAKTRQRQYTLCRNWVKQKKIKKNQEKSKNDCSATVLRVFCGCSASVLRVFCECSAGVLRVSFGIFHVFNCFSLFRVVHAYSKQFLPILLQTRPFFVTSSLF